MNCASCGKISSVRRVARGGPTLALVPSSRVTTIDTTVREPDRVSLLLPTLDRAFGVNRDGRGGFALGAIYTLAGDPGAGKSTMGMLLAESLQRITKVLYVCSESTREMFSRMAMRTGIGKKLPLLFTQNVADIIEEADCMGALAVVVDQLHSLEPRTDSFEHAKRLVAFAQDSGRSLVLLGERTKAGQTRGNYGIEYAADARLGLEKPLLAPDEPADRSQRRWLTVSKNRHGGDGVYPLMLTEKGWAEVPPPPDPPAPPEAPPVH